MTDLFNPPERLGLTFNPVLDTERLTTNTQRVYALLRDGQWHLGVELRGCGGAQGERRARDLRDARFGSLVLDVERHPDFPAKSGVWRYRLNVNMCTPDTLAQNDIRFFGAWYRTSPLPETP